VTTVRYAFGLAALALVCGSLTVASLALRRRFLSYLEGAVAWLAGIVIALSLLVLILELLGAVGLFRLGPILVASVLCAFAVLRLAGWKRRPPDAARNIPGFGALLVTVLTAAVLIAEYAGPSLTSYEFGIRGFDSLWYHLPWAASFAQSGQITSLRFTDVEYLTAFYPATAELLHGLGIVLIGRDTLSPGLNAVWLGLSLLAAYCIGRPRGLGHATMLGAALALAAPTMTLSQGGSAANDIVGIFFVLSATAFLLAGEGRPGELALAGLAAGLAVSVKLSMLAPAVLLVLAGIAAGGEVRRRRRTTILIGTLALAGGFWYLRNLISVGNPLPWVGIPGLATPAPALQQHTGFSIAHYLTDTHIWSTFFGPGLRGGLGDLWPVVLFVAIAGPLLCLARGTSRIARLGALAALLTLLAYLVTPESAAGPAGQPLGFAFNLRYGIPALALALAVAPLAPPLNSSPARRQLTAGALGALLIVTLLQDRLWPHRQLLGAIGVGAAVLLVGLVIASRIVRPRNFVTVPRALVGVAIAVLVLAGAAGGYAWQKRYLRGRYAFQPGISYLGHVWAMFRAVHQARVALVGSYGAFFGYPLFGLDVSNRVQYVGMRGSNGSFTPITTCGAWRSALNAGHFRYVVTTPARDPWRRKQLLASPEGAWTGSDPAAKRIYTKLATRQRISVYRLTGELNPAGC
jgi:hypothetical protein